MHTPQSSTALSGPLNGGHRGRRLARAFALILTGLLTTNCACSRTQTVAVSAEAGVTPGAKSTETPATPVAPAAVMDTAAAELPAGLDTGDLDAAEKTVLSEILKEQFDPCGKAGSFFDALNSADSCDAAPRLAKLVVARLADGWSKKQTVALMMKELAQLSQKFEFDLTGVPCLGDKRAGQKIIVEFSDFQCPFCAKAFQPAKAAAEKYGALLCAKQLPLDFHEFSRPAALAALAAHQQGKYWEYADRVLEQQAALSEERLVAIAKELSLDMAQFKADRASDAIAAAVKRDLDESELAGVEGTPSFFVDGIAVSFESLEDALAAAGNNP